MKHIAVNYFALFREQAGRASEAVDTDAATVGELFTQMQQQHAGLQAFDAMKFARNDELVTADTNIEDGDKILFFPPVAGG